MGMLGGEMRLWDFTPEIVDNMVNIMGFHKLYRREQKMRPKIVRKLQLAIDKGNIEEVEKVSEEEKKLTEKELDYIFNIANNSEQEIYGEHKAVFEASIDEAKKNPNPEIKTFALKQLAEGANTILKTMNDVRLMWHNIENNRVRMATMKLTTEAMQISKADDEDRAIGKDIKKIEDYANKLAKARKLPSAQNHAKAFQAYVKDEADKLHDLNANLINIVNDLYKENKEFFQGIINLKTKGFPTDEIDSEKEKDQELLADLKSDEAKVSQSAMLLMRMYGRVAQKALSYAK
tara:strand:+ start:632 stop:1504 length:873 start_codon:yes stop_codon:yes gene_type:complete